jgi:hypothetical protein
MYSYFQVCALGLVPSLNNVPEGLINLTGSQWQGVLAALLYTLLFNLKQIHKIPVRESLLTDGRISSDVVHSCACAG